MRDAGSVHLSVLSVAPWSVYVAALRPTFHLSADEALARVAADSRWMLQRDSRTLGAGSEPIILGSTDEGNGIDQVFEAPRRTRPEVPVSESGMASGGGVPLGETPPATGPDAMLKYTAATALFQEVQLLNRYIEDAAIPNGFRPYVVRLQVSLMPSRRHAPYDAYTTLSFFLPDRSRRIGAEADQPAAESTAGREIFESTFGDAPKILPLLVTDNLEASVNARSLDRVVDMLGSYVNFSGADFVEPLFEAFLNEALREEVYGRDLNSLLTIARLSDNTLRIRLGAVQETTADYAMVPRNHNITLLVMVPEGFPALMEVVSKTVLVDATTGQKLAGSQESDLLPEIRELLSGWQVDDLTSADLEQLLAFTRKNQQERFSQFLRARLPPEHPVLRREQALWIELVTFKLGSAYDSHLFELPGQDEDLEESARIFQTQTVVAEDDGSTMRIVLREARVPEYEKVLALFTLNAGEPRPAGDEGGAQPEAEPHAQEGNLPHLVLPAESVDQDSARNELRLSFPSLTRLQLVEDPGVQRFELHLSWAGETVSFDVLHRVVEPRHED